MSEMLTSLVTPSTMLATSGPNSSTRSGTFVGVSSATSCSSAAATVRASRRRSARMRSDRQGMHDVGSPDLRF